jgi:hypothetical protein
MLKTLLWSTVAGTLLSRTLGPACRAGHPHIEIGPNVQVSKARANLRHFEVVIAADPTGARRLLIGAMTMNGPGLAVYRSFDGGQTWELVFEKTSPAPTGKIGDPGQLARWNDPAVA